MRLQHLTDDCIFMPPKYPIMTRSLILLATLLVLFVASCKKETEDPPPVDQRTPLVFNELSASADTVRVSEYTTLTATATGDELTFTWTPEYGTIIGSGASVQWNVCHPDIFTITCEVQDKYGEKLSKSVDIHVNP